MFNKIRESFGLTGAHGIARRYFVVNGFDGALTMLGLIVGFYLSDYQDLHIVISACMGAAVALTVSGISSAYISETAEKQKELGELEQAMIKDLSDTIHGRASRLLPVLIALVNGISPFLLSLLIISPIIVAQLSLPLPVPPLVASFLVAIAVLFGLGLYLGRISGTSLMWSGIRALIIALVTSVIIVGINLI
jgi:predicted membrane protein (TIGR00267 family)